MPSISMQRKKTVVAGRHRMVAISLPMISMKVSNCHWNGKLEIAATVVSCFNVVEDEQYEYVWLTGPEMQVLDNTCHPDAKIQTHRAGDLYDMIECKYVTVKPAGQWNKVRLVIDNGKVETLAQWPESRSLRTLDR